MTGAYGQRWGLVLVLAVLCVLALAGAWWIYPRESSLAAPGAPEVTFDTPSPVPGQLVVTVSKGHSAGLWDLKVQVNRYGLATAPGPVSAFVRLPVDSRYQSCSGAQCKPTADPGFGAIVSVAGMTFEPTASQQSNWDADADLTIQANSFVWATNDTTAQAVLPSVRLRVDGTAVNNSDPTTGNPDIFTELVMPGGDRFDWTGGPPPISRSNGTILWDQKLEATGTFVSASGVDHAAQRSNDFWLFVAGALAGIGGGLFLGVLQEAWPHSD